MPIGVYQIATYICEQPIRTSPARLLGQAGWLLAGNRARLAEGQEEEPIGA